MNIRSTAAILAALVMTSPAYAGKKNKKFESENRNRNIERRAESKRIYLAAESFMKSRDANGDGSLNRHEFILLESDQEAAGALFDEANKNGDRCLTISEIAAMPELLAKAPKGKKK